MRSLESHRDEWVSHAGLHEGWNSFLESVSVSATCCHANNGMKVCQFFSNEYIELCFFDKYFKYYLSKMHRQPHYNIYVTTCKWGDLPFDFIKKKRHEKSSLYTYSNSDLSAGNPAFWWQEAAPHHGDSSLSMVSCRSKASTHMHTQSDAIYGRGSDLEICEAKRSQERSDAQIPPLFIQSITFNHSGTHKHFHSCTLSTLWSMQPFK